MPAYLIITAHIHDRERFVSGYGKEAARLVERFGGEYLLRAPGAQSLEGSHGDGASVVVSRWPDKAAAIGFWNSPEYAEVKRLRGGIADCNVLLVEAP
ncbi:DUF1330 domain-containing protein [Porphyrobacter sp. GA68]|uniref:DUF1330 domain-containing protein n=1 Tax=Porphyrobacter sp. GA68 TaxID=2883480 RepID=UPI001D188D70|nr:DUF1330 domain-containing protein [Porphyrobacter sp. GA68]